MTKIISVVPVEDFVRIQRRDENGVVTFFSLPKSDIEGLIVLLKQYV